MDWCASGKRGDAQDMATAGKGVIPLANVPINGSTLILDPLKPTGRRWLTIPTTPAALLQSVVVAGSTIWKVHHVSEREQSGRASAF